MVRILNGEIVQDDDPRLQQSKQQAPAYRPPAQQHQFVATRGPAGPAAGAAPVQPVGFDWNAPPFRALPTEGSALPDVEIFGLRVPAVGLIAVAAAGVFFGWRGLLAGVIFGYLYLTYGQNAAGGGGGGGGAAAAGKRAAGSSGLMGQGFADAFGGGGGEGTHAPERPGQQLGRAQQPGGSPWTGKGRKLGSN